MLRYYRLLESAVEESAASHDIAIVLMAPTMTAKPEKVNQLARAHHIAERLVNHCAVQDLSEAILTRLNALEMTRPAETAP